MEWVLALNLSHCFSNKHAGSLTNLTILPAIELAYQGIQLNLHVPLCIHTQGQQEHLIAACQGPAF
eukprot:scaffold489988_cov20-Prasinocladus_malaysianus.AAC.1